ncbi:ARID DNA-binding domain-containing protein [Tanacetum coccineum]
MVNVQTVDQIMFFKRTRTLTIYGNADMFDGKPDYLLQLRFLPIKEQTAHLCIDNDPHAVVRHLDSYHVPFIQVVSTPNSGEGSSTITSLATAVIPTNSLVHTDVTTISSHKDIFAVLSKPHNHSIMVHTNMLKTNWLGKNPVKHWYQSYGSDYGGKPKPIHTRHDQGGFTRGYLLRETPQRLLSWNNRKKSLSPNSKKMLFEKMQEIEAFNASRVSAKARGHGENTQKEKRARCYKCKVRGHVYWKCPNKKQEGMKGKQKEELRPEVKKDAVSVKFPEEVHVNTDYMVEGTNEGNWNEIWYISSTYKFHMCPTRHLFKRLKYKFEMIGKEETEKKFIFSYGIGDIIMEAKEGNFVVTNVHYTPEVTVNVLSYDLLEEQGYMVEIDNNKCYIHYMFGGKGKEKVQEKSSTDDDGLMDAVTEHNKYLQKYFESLEPKEEEVSLVKGLEDLKWNKEDEQDYVDDEYISWNGSLYALKVNSISRFLSFIDLLKKDSLVYENWEIFSKKFVEMVKWFYLVYLNYERLDKIPPRVGVMEINLLSLHKIIDNLGGYLCVTLGEKWKVVASLQARRPWYDVKPGKEVGESSRVGANGKDLQGKDKGNAGIEETLDVLEENMAIKTKLGVKLESNMVEDSEQGSITDSNDFEVIM